MEEFKENRGRPLKYNWPKDKGSQLTITVNSKAKKVSARMAAYLYADRHGLKFRTWMVSETKMVVECVWTKEHQKDLLVEVMRADEKDGLYL